MKFCNHCGTHLTHYDVMANNCSQCHKEIDIEEVIAEEKEMEEEE
jgi:DNA-directed RNA polymerase subunit M/transcription elongation factor TFIIS